MDTEEDKKRRHDIFVKLNRVSVLIAKNATRVDRGENLVFDDWEETFDLLGDCAGVSWTANASFSNGGER